MDLQEAVIKEFENCAKSNNLIDTRNGFIVP